MSEALIFASTNLQYDDRLFVVHENGKLRIPAEHIEYINCCFRFDIQNNFGAQHVLQMLRASEKDLSVMTNQTIMNQGSRNRVYIITQFLTPSTYFLIELLQILVILSCDEFPP